MFLQFDSKVLESYITKKKLYLNYIVQNFVTAQIF